MSTTETIDGWVAEPPEHCESCGALVTGGRFCSACGHEIAAPVEALPEHEQAWAAEFAGPGLHGAAEPRPHDEPYEPYEPHAAGGWPDEPLYAAPTAVHAPPAPGAGKRRVLVIVAAVVALLVAAGAAAAIVLTSSGDPEAAADLAYRKQVAAAFGPVLGANREVSDELGSLRGTRPADARAAVRRARQATTLATGAIGALAVPAGSERLARDARVVLDREGAYLSAVAAVLARPSDPTRAELRTLSSNLTGALSAAGPAVAGRSQTVSGTDELAAWAQRASRTLERRAAAKKRARVRGATPVSPGATPPVPPASGQPCGGGVYAGPNTSCAFARNVRAAYYEAPGRSATVRVFSPVTDTTYTMSCAPSGSAVTCSGGNDASVTF
jgi:hypothetical protein